MSFDETEITLPEYPTKFPTKVTLLKRFTNESFLMALKLLSVELKIPTRILFVLFKEERKPLSEIPLIDKRGTYDRLNLSRYKLLSESSYAIYRLVW